MNFHFPLLFHQHLFYWRIAWQLPCICETSSVNILKVNFYSCGWVWSFFFSFFSWGRRDRSVLKAISLWWQVWLSVPRKYGLIFFLVFFLILEQGAYHLSQYYSIILSWFHFWGALHLFVVSSLPTLKPKLLFLVPCIWKTGNIWYDALLFLSIKICLVLHYSEWSSESVGICVSYFNYLSTWWLLFPSVDWNFRMQVRGLHILSLIIKTGHILFLFSLWKSFRLLILDPFLGMYGLKRPLY